MRTELSQSISDTKRWLIVIAVMTIAILEVLDSTVVNVALTSMMSSLGANSDQITWVLTSYVVASAIMIPLTGFLSHRIGIKRLLLVNIAGFMIFSMLCGMSTSLSEMVTFRLLQGAFGAALIPLSQSILRQSFPLDQQGKAMAIWGMGIMVAPILGPTLGGYIVDYSSWRWIFYLNVPFCIAGFILASIVIPAIAGRKRAFDWQGIIFMVLGIGCLQLFLDQGNTHDWFQSHLIVVLFSLSLIGLIFFIYHSLTTQNPAVKLHLFRDRNFTLCTVIFAIFAGNIFGLLTLEPIMLQTIFQYTAIDAGLAMAPMGLFSTIGIMISTSLMKRLPAKYLIAAGLLSVSIGAYSLSHLTLDASFNVIRECNFGLGLGLGLLMVPLSAFALATLNQADITDGSGLFSYGRMLGTSVGTSLLSTLASRLSQVNWNRLNGHVNPFNDHLTQWLEHSHGSLQNSGTLSTLQQTIASQAAMQAYIDAFHLVSILMLCAIPIALFTRHVNLSQIEMSAH